MGWAVHLAAQAERDLRDIVRFIARDDPAAAERFGLALLTRAESLGRMPRLGIKVRGWPDVRALLHGRYYVIYRRSESAKLIEVIRFWHSARDLGALKATELDV